MPRYMSEYKSGDVIVAIRLYQNVGRVKWEYKATLDGQVLAEGNDLETAHQEQVKAVDDVLTFLTCADTEMRNEHGWTFNVDDLTDRLGYSDDGITFFMIEKVRPRLAPILRKLKERTDRYLILSDGYWGYRDSGAESYCDEATYSLLVKYWSRYSRFCHYIREVLPEWRDVEDTPYADNSVETVQINKYGQQRQVMKTAPHGDACY